MKPQQPIITQVTITETNGTNSVMWNCPPHVAMGLLDFAQRYIGKMIENGFTMPVQHVMPSAPNLQAVPPIEPKEEPQT